MKKMARKRKRMQRQLKVATKMVRESGGVRESVGLRTPCPCPCTQGTGQMQAPGFWPGTPLRPETAVTRPGTDIQMTDGHKAERDMKKVYFGRFWIWIWVMLDAHWAVLRAPGRA